MKRIFFVVLSAAFLVSCSKGGKAGAGKPGSKGELIPKKKSKSFVAERPYGMIAIPAGSFVMGMADQDFTNTPEKANLKTVTVSSFFMEQTMLNTVFLLNMYATQSREHYLQKLLVMAELMEMEQV